jgi:antitoxin ParD1/3/4
MNPLARPARVQSKPFFEKGGRLRFDGQCPRVYYASVHVSLTPELERFVKEKVESGLYNDASEVIREALRLALRLESANDWLKREAAIGVAQLDAGETIRVTTRKQFLALASGN